MWELRQPPFKATRQMMMQQDRAIHITFDGIAWLGRFRRFIPAVDAERESRQLKRRLTFHLQKVCWRSSRRYRMRQRKGECMPNQKTRHEQLVAAGWTYDAQQNRYSPPEKRLAGTERWFDEAAAWREYQAQQVKSAGTAAPTQQRQVPIDDPRKQRPD